MKSNMMTIMKKELARFFKDKRMVFTTILMPGLLIYAMYTFMGTGLSGMMTTEEDFVPQVYTVNLPETFSDVEELPLEFIETEDIEETKKRIKDGDEECNLLVVFPENFEETLNQYDVTTGEKAPEVEMYYNSTETDSGVAYDIMYGMLDSYESSITNKFDVNSLEKKYDLATEEDTTGMMFSMMIPMLMMIFLFSGCMAVAPESIAGEKERGTLATLLVTPMKRGHLALGKIISLSIIAVLSGLSSFIGTMLSLPKMSGAGMDGISASVYQPDDYVMLLLVIMTTVLILVALISIISGFAKSVKEAGTWVTGLMMLILVIAITSMFEGLKPTNLFMYMIPLYNSAQCMGGICSFSIGMAEVLVTAASNLVYTFICVGILTKMFNSERIVFTK